jgi:hypothetical protein
MKRNYYITIALAALFCGALTGCIVESPPPPRPAPPPIPSPAAIDARQRDLEFRIEQGFKSGYITRDEHQLLRRMADDVRREERQYMNDGQLSLDERRALSARLDQLARELDRQLRDKDRR